MTGILFPAAKPRFLTKPNNGEAPTIVWDFDSKRPALSSAFVGGGLRSIDWVLNIGVPLDYSRIDLTEHAAEVAANAGLLGRGLPGSGLLDSGVALFTAADTTRIQHQESDGLRVDTTVGISRPTWAADADGVFTDWSKRAKTPPSPGTINIVIQLPVVLTEAAAVNAIITVTEAKTQALIEASIPGTGTASDAVVICWAPTPGNVGAIQKSSDSANSSRDDTSPVAFMGPRSVWGSRLARAVRDAVARGIAVSG